MSLNGLREKDFFSPIHLGTHTLYCHPQKKWRQRTKYTGQHRITPPITIMPQLFFLCAQERGSVFFSFAVPSSRFMSDRLNCGSLSSQPMSTCRLMPGMKSWKCLSTQPQNTDSPILSCSSLCDSHDISTAAQIQAGYGNPGRFSC